MSPFVSASTPSSGPVPVDLEAFRTTGSSPGVTGSLIRSIPFEHSRRHRHLIRWEAHGRAGSPTVLVLGGISANRHLLPTLEQPYPGWWPGIVGPDCVLDPRHYRLIGIDYATGSDGAPIVTTGDQARIALAALDAFNAASVTVIGASYGGMVGLALAVLAPDRVDRLVVACAAHRPHPMATGLRALQRDIIRLGLVGAGADQGVRLARAVAMTTYRSAVEFDARFSSRAESIVGSEATFPVQSYLHARGDSFAHDFDAASYLGLSQSIDLHDISPETLTAPTTLISVDTDSIVPPFLADELESRAPAVRQHVRIRSPFGHDAFLKEPEQFGEAIRDALQAGEVGE